jgi:hypothetical protein
LDPGCVVTTAMSQPAAAASASRADSSAVWTPRRRCAGAVGELDLHRGAAGGEGPLDLVEGGRARRSAKSEPGDLVERRVLLGEAGHAARDRDHEARPVRPPAAGGLAGPGDELRLNPFDAPGQGSVAEEGQPASAHAPSLGAERDDVAEARVQFLAAGQAPRPVHDPAAAAADPEPGRVLPAVDAELDGAGLLPGQLFLRLRRQPVHRHPEVVTSGAAQRGMLNRAVRAREREALRDLGGDAAIGARDDG